MKKAKKDEFKVEFEGDNIWVWNNEDSVGLACTSDLSVEDLTEAQVEKLVQKAKDQLMPKQSYKKDSLESFAYKVANPRK